MYRILSILLIFVSSLFHPLLLSAAIDSSHSIEKTESNAHLDPAAPSTDDHGFVFPLEDLMENPDKHNDRFYTEFFNMIATLGLVIGIILIAAWFLRRLLNTRLEQINTSSIIKIVEKRALSPKSAVYLLEIYDKIVVIAETANGITQLGEFAIPPENEIIKDNIPPPFSKILEQKNPKM